MCSATYTFVKKKCAERAAQLLLEQDPDYVPATRNAILDEDEVPAKKTKAKKTKKEGKDNKLGSEMEMAPVKYKT